MRFGFRRTRRVETVAALRAAVDALPRQAREAMLAGISEERIIAGAYVDKRGGVCPILAAHRRGVRSRGADFARAWDEFTGARGRPMRVHREHLRTLELILRVSLEVEREEAAPVAEAWLRPVVSYDGLRAALRAVGLEAELPAACQAETVPPSLDLQSLVVALERAERPA
jgi:hypothetical protein